MSADELGESYTIQIGNRGWKHKITPYMVGQLLTLGFYTALGYVELREYGRYKADESHTSFFKSSSDKIDECDGLDWSREGTTGTIINVVTITIPLLTVYIAFPLYYGTFNQIKGLVTLDKDRNPFKFAGGYTVLSGILSTYVGLREIKCGMESITLAWWSYPWIMFLFLVLIFSAFVVLGSMCAWGRPTCGFLSCVIRYCVIGASIVTFLGKVASTAMNLSLIFNFDFFIPATLGVVSWIDTIVSLAVDLWLYSGGECGNCAATEKQVDAMEGP